MEYDETDFFKHLQANPDIVEKYITGRHITNEVFERWGHLRRKTIESESNSVPKGSWSSYDLSSRRRIILDQGDEQARMLYETAQCCGHVVGTNTLEAVLLNDDGSFRVLKDEDGNLKIEKIAKKGRRASIYSQKVIGPSENTLGEINFYRQVNDSDRQAVNVICTWAAASIHFAQMASHLSGGENGTFETLAKERKLSNFLLDVTRSFFQDIVSMDTVIIKIMNFAQSLVNADRASLFLVDQKTQELYARIFDVGTGEEEHAKIREDGKKEIRFPMNKGIAGHVASTGIGLNIENAYDDERFNKDVDSTTGYTTKSILCMPILIRNHVIGVVQMVNKADGPFTQADEDSFVTFAVYCGLALHHAKLYDKIRRSEQRYRVALEVLAYHSVCHRDEVNKLKKVEAHQPHKRIVELETFDFNGMRLSELEKPLYAVYMFKALFTDEFRVDGDDLIRFVLTVRKNYRRVAYHNWAHGWSVAHAMFVMLHKNKAVFSVHEALVLYVSCLCHDLDHRGKNNAYMKTMSSPLASIYTTSVMEHHHFNQTVTILQQDGHNILKSMTSDEYKNALGLIKHSILATDLALFFSNKAELSNIVEAGNYSITNPQHRKLVQAVLMTGCDLIASAKPWQIQTETVKVIFEEFYEQGDAERKNGREPIAMMDRNKAHELPQMQVGFMRGICLPCYDLIAKVLPDMSSLRDRCKYNAEKWEELAEEQKRLNEGRTPL